MPDPVPAIPMPYAHFLISAEGGETEQRLQDFLRRHAILKVEQRFVDRPDGLFWAYAVHYDVAQVQTGSAPPARQLGKDRIDYQQKLSEPDFALYVKLRDWRKELSEKEGIPPFSVFHNATLASIAEARPADAKALQEISGVGAGRRNVLAWMCWGSWRAPRRGVETEFLASWNSKHEGYCPVRTGGRKDRQTAPWN